jgi:hypothetical protein
VRESPIFDWLFRNRHTGEITIGQMPNAALWAFIVAWGLELLLDPGGAIGTGLDVVAGVSLLVWSVEEVLLGVNPFRRLLGAVVLGGILARFV